MKYWYVVRLYRYEIIAFLAGFAVMVLEIVGARLVAPAFGTSTYVWTAMIGVILGSLAVGYALGGKMADIDNTPRSLAVLLTWAAIVVGVAGMLQAPVLSTISSWHLDLRLGAFLGALALFSIPSLLLGMVSPHLAKLRVRSLETTGQSIGRLEAAGAVGSITGTFLAGYLLLGWFGSRSLIFGVAIILLATSFVASKRLWLWWRLGVAVVLLLALIIGAHAVPGVLADIDTRYARYRVQEGVYQAKNVHFLSTDEQGIQSGVDIDNPYQPIFPYTYQFFAAAQRYPQLDRVLMIGGGTFTVPSALVYHDSTVRVDVVEIDPALTKLAKQYFSLADSSRLHILNEDGRTYLNANQQKYDITYIDAFSSLSPPFHLTTAESVKHVRESLTDKGIAIVNLVGSNVVGEDEYIRANYATYRAIFPYVQVYSASPGDSGQNGQTNMILFASVSKTVLDTVTGGYGDKPLLVADGGMVLRDDFAPIERLTF